MIRSRISSPPNREITTPFSLTPFLNSGYKGFYLVEIANPEESWRSTSKLISISDIGLIAKTSYDEVLVFATNLLTTEPMPNVTVSLVSTTNQVVATVEDGSRRCRTVHRHGGEDEGLPAPARSRRRRRTISTSCISMTTGWRPRGMMLPESVTLPGRTMRCCTATGTSTVRARR